MAPLWTKATTLAKHGADRRRSSAIPQRPRPAGVPGGIRHAEGTAGAVGPPKRVPPSSTRQSAAARTRREPTRQELPLSWRSTEIASNLKAFRDRTRFRER
ncbi:Protein of unknown function [Gryllus bimaculatus]|nr:Protein of unknown function [Gryllus bimaculatus]